LLGLSEINMKEFGPLREELLSEQNESWVLPPELYSCWNARGLYNPLQFVLRLRPDIHKELDSIAPGIKSSSDLTFPLVQAFSTYFHETIHWWQHVGSTYGLLSSLIYPAQAHINKNYLIEILEDIGPYKPILGLDSNLTLIKSDRTRQNINKVLNNWHDIEFFRRLTIDPKKAPSVLNSPYFECQGHSYNMSWSSVLWLIASTFDSEFSVIPDIRLWESEFDKLKKKKVEGYYYGSRVVLSPIGAREIFEGQARISQIQYLFLASGGHLNWKEFSELGMLEGVYKEAFDHFLKIIGAPWPSNPNDPLVGLFLLVCDISINPTDGFPFNIYHFDSFVISVDPGMRFLELSMIIRDKIPNLKSSVQKYSKDEYLEVSEVLCKNLVCHTPHSAAVEFNRWSEIHSPFIKLLEEDESFKFSPENLPVRVFFARFLLFQKDKIKTPEFFCWPGVWTTGVHAGDIELAQSEILFEKHRAIFVDREDGDVYPRTFEEKDEKSVLETFNSFYSWCSIYELTRQWIVNNGEFDFNFLWLTSKYSQEQVTDWASDNFEKTFGVDPRSFKIT